MRVLFVTPSEVSSGEAVTALHMADDLRRAGGDVRFLASGFTARIAGGVVDELGPDLVANQRTFHGVTEDFGPDAVVFADYPLLFFANGVAPMAGEGLLAGLDRAATLLVTLDHLGYAQGSRTVFFGPPHLSFHAATFPALPGGMQVLLPCPSHDPEVVHGRRGIPFRYWEPPGRDEPEARAAIRRRYGVREGEVLVVHATPQWAWRMAEQFGLPYYRFLPSLLDHYLGDLPVAVTVVSVNNGKLLAAAPGLNVRVVNLGPLPMADYERLLLACDLLVSENGISVSIGKAVCAQVPCVLLRNSFGLAELVDRADPVLRRALLDMESVRLGSVFPYEVFPVWRRDEVPMVTVPGCIAVEVFGGVSTHKTLHRLLLDDAYRTEVRTVQQAYAGRIAALPSPYEALRSVLARSPS